MRRWACFCSLPQKIPTLTRASSGSPCGRGSSVVHGAIMGVQALNDPTERGHLVGDVPAQSEDTCPPTPHGVGLCICFAPKAHFLRLIPTRRLGDSRGIPESAVA